MVTQQIAQYTNASVNEETCKKFHHEDRIITNVLLYLGFFFIVIFFVWMEYHNHEKRKKEEQGELQKEIDQRRAQFRNDWQNASLYPGSAFSCSQ
ncbi:uncharacterized protein LOC116588961 isoform X2 [Mustela erminea]|uniref:uncharacterized protein LOC116588961 isoform X2 n=1 Tax=Mustela erminea TaxID=36723 RepID=UPI001386CE3C|nr:uncharacterized protein LOC116588961 isoform X2 [Mustela erminea]